MSIEWSDLCTFELKNGDVGMPWVLACEAFGDANRLRLTATGDWQVTGSVLPACGPDGTSNLTLPNEQLVLSDCRFAALIGKIGGSSARHRIPATPTIAPLEDEPFAIGTFCIVKVPDELSGPLFIGFNALLRPIQMNTALTLIVSGARLDTK